MDDKVGSGDVRCGFRGFEEAARGCLVPAQAVGGAAAQSPAGGEAGDADAPRRRAGARARRRGRAALERVITGGRGALAGARCRLGAGGLEARGIAGGARPRGRVARRGEERRLLLGGGVAAARRPDELPNDSYDVAFGFSKAVRVAVQRGRETKGCCLIGTYQQGGRSNDRAGVHALQATQQAAFTERRVAVHTKKGASRGCVHQLSAAAVAPRQNMQRAAWHMRTLTCRPGNTQRRPHQQHAPLRRPQRRRAQRARRRGRQPRGRARRGGGSGCGRQRPRGREGRRVAAVKAVNSKKWREPPGVDHIQDRVYRLQPNQAVPALAVARGQRKRGAGAGGREPQRGAAAAARGGGRGAEREAAGKEQCRGACACAGQAPGSAMRSIAWRSWQQR